jgi:hypothetical protein
MGRRKRHCGNRLERSGAQSERDALYEKLGYDFALRPMRKEDMNELLPVLGAWTACERRGADDIVKGREILEDVEGTMKIIPLSELKTFPEPRELTPEELKEAYALARAAFTAEDLQRYTELDEGVPAEDVIREMEELESQLDQSQQ